MCWLCMVIVGVGVVLFGRLELLLGELVFRFVVVGKGVFICVRCD